MNLLIPYVQLLNHNDPLLDEFTYGDVGSRGRKLRNSLNKEDYVFFHTTINNRKYITAYYVVDRVIKTQQAAKDIRINNKYKNPHIVRVNKNEDNFEDDYILFGDPILSKVLDRPLLFDRSLAFKLSLNIHFPPNKSEAQSIGSATRAWRELTNNDAKIILNEISLMERESIDVKSILSTDEIVELLERDIEYFIEKNPKLFVNKIVSVRRQVDTPAGRIDLIFEDNKNNIIIIEIKLNKIGNEAVNQLRRYINWASKKTNKKVSGIIICNGVMSAFQNDLQKLKSIKIFCYGWQLKVYKWN